MTASKSKVPESQQLFHGFQRISVVDGAEAFVEMLNSNGVEYLFLNSGTDTFPVQEAIVRMANQGRRVPQIIVCPDEMTAACAAQGFFQLTRRPQVVMVHVDAGTLQIGGAYHNILRDHSGVVICAGRSPTTIGEAAPGSRDYSGQWLQEPMDQHGIVRTFTKWDYEVSHTASLNWALQKAFQVANNEPAGAVYLTLPRENLMAKLEYVDVPPPNRHAASITPSADPRALETLADWLVTASNPVIITGTPGRNPEAVGHLAALAETAGVPVYGGISTRLNLPSSHPLNGGSLTDAVIQEADLILLIDVDIPWVPSKETLEPQARIAWIDIDPTKDAIPLWTFPADLLIHADSRKALPALVQAVSNRLTSADRERIEERAARILEAFAARRQKALAAAQAASKDRPLNPAWIGYCLEQLLPQNAIFLKEEIPVTVGGLFDSVLNRNEPNSVFASGGASLGWAMGAALGAKLAEPARDVVAVVGDGTFIYARPTSAFWVAEKYKLPFLTIILNNSGHLATRWWWTKNIPDGVARQTDDFAGVDLQPSPDYDMLIRACHGYGEKVEDPAEVLPSLERGLERVRDGQAALLDMRTIR